MTAPDNFILPALAECRDYCRYAIAYGLSIPPGEEVHINGLPKDAGEIEVNKQLESYQNRCDSIAFNLYGEHM